MDKLHSKDPQEMTKRLETAQNLLMKTMDLQVPSLRYGVAHQIIENLFSDDVWNLYQQTGVGSAAHSQLPAFLLSALSENTFQNKVITEMLTVLNTRKSSKDTPALKDNTINTNVIDSLTVMLQDQSIENQKKFSIVQELLNKKYSQKSVEKLTKDEIKHAVESLKKLKGLFQIKGQSSLLDWKEGENIYEFIQAHYLEAIQKLIPLSIDLSQSTQQMDACLGKFRDRSLLLRYASKLATLPQGEDKRMLDYLVQSIEDFIQGDFPNSRYQEENNPHLKKVFQTTGLKEEWTQKHKVLLNNLLETNDSSLSNLTVEETDDFVDLFSCGTEVLGSCQTVDGNVKLNKCLLAYVQDGKNRLVTIKDKSGKILARSILRLLIDQATDQPVLFMETIYPKRAPPLYREGLLALAKQKAGILNLPLLSKETGSISYPNEIISLGSNVPYEYVDAAEGVTRGKFIIQTALIAYIPRPETKKF